MKKIALISTTVLMSSMAMAFSFKMPSFFQKPVSYKCTGEAEYGKYKIENLVLNEKEISLRYADTDGNYTDRTYVTLNFMKKNSGKTDVNKNVYIIDGSASGRSNDYDDISLAHFGEYKSGLGSEIAFETKTGRAIGTVSCTQE